MKIKRDARIAREIKRAMHEHKREGKYEDIQQARAIALGRARRKFGI